MSLATRAHSLRNRPVAPAALDRGLVESLAGLLLGENVVPLIQRKPVDHEPSVTVTADGRYRPSCGVDRCIDDYASNLPGMFRADDALDYANELLAENENGPSGTDPRHSDVTRGWGLPA